MVRINRSVLLNRNLCGYNGQCPQHLSTEDGGKIMVASGLAADPAFASRFTEIVENFGVELLESLKKSGYPTTADGLERLTREIELA